ncbi:MAG: hypothetical protein NHB15_16275 [Methanosarcina barkeri]|nr:hypothetical protein [Methanosarcina sp. ERenArc_MAG2]
MVKITIHFLNVKPASFSLVKKRHSIFGLDNYQEEVLKPLAVIPERGSMRAVSKCSLSNCRNWSSFKTACS